MQARPNMTCGNRGVPLIVFADDHPDTLETLKFAAEARGYEVVTCQTGRELLEKVNELCETQCCPDMIVADVQYFDTGNTTGPRVTGITAGAEIRRAFPDIPILYLTAFASTIIRTQAREQGASVEQKPIRDWDAFFERIGYMMEYAGRKDYYTGPERREKSVNITGHNRRATDKRVGVPKVVSDALWGAKSAKKAQTGR